MTHNHTKDGEFPFEHASSRGCLREFLSRPSGLLINNLNINLLCDDVKQRSWSQRTND